VVDEPAVLHRLLTAHVTALGPLLALDRAGAAGPLGGFDADALARVPARARAIETAFAAWGIGRGRPVDRAALVDSGAVTPTFMDRVCELAAEVHGDADALLQGLDEGRVPRFQTARLEQLRSHLEAEGYRTDETRLDAAAIIHRVLAAGAEDLAAGRIDPAWVNALVSRLPDLPATADSDD
jgi:hypothetical protein